MKKYKNPKSSKKINVQRKKKPKSAQKKKLNKKSTYVSSTNVLENDTSENDVLDMMSDDDFSNVQDEMLSNPYAIYKELKCSSKANTKSRKRKIVDDDQILENTYESCKKPYVPTKQLLPIKTQYGLIPQQILESEDDDGDIDQSEQNTENELSNSEYESNLSESKKTMDIVTAERYVNEKKIEIGVLSANILENPEEKISSLKSLLSIMDDEHAAVYVIVKKVCTLSLLEIFKDLLPSYEIKIINSNVKLKKETLKLKKYEETLLLYYKKFLRKLEGFVSRLKARKYNGKTEDVVTVLGMMALNGLCDLLVCHPYFNYSVDIVQLIVPFLDHRVPDIRNVLKKAIIMVFKSDKKYHISLQIVRNINRYMKKRSNNVHSEMMDVLLHLKIKDVNLDQEKEDEIKNKKELLRKQKFTLMSRRDRRKKKQKKELDRQMQETKAEENKQLKNKNLTEITKLVFEIYFKILKTNNNGNVLRPCLQGLTKFAHAINIEFYLDLVCYLYKLLNEDALDYREKLHCIQTVFAICSGQGESLNIDPNRFYKALYRDLMLYYDASKEEDIFEHLLSTLTMALVDRRKKNSKQRMISYTKRLTTMSLQLLHNSALSNLCLIKNLMQTNKYLDILLDTDNVSGGGGFLPELDDPEHANADSTALYELSLLSKHYHPTVSNYAKYIASTTLETPNSSLLSGYSNCTPEDFRITYSMQEMAFHPPVPPPKKVSKTKITKLRHFVDSYFEIECKNLLAKH